MRNLLSSSYDCCTLEMIEQGSVNSKLEYLVTSLHGQNAEIIKSMETSERIHIALSLGKQMIRVLKVLHKLGYVHGDIKPHNILFDDNNFGLQTCEASDSSYKFVLIDFGIAQKYVNDEGSVLPKTKLKSFRGNLEFAAEECLQKYNPMPRHDLISLMYTILYLISERESLWKSDEYDFWIVSDSMNDSIEGKIQKMIAKKQRATTQYLCRDFPMLEDFCKKIMKSKDYIDYEELIKKLNECQQMITKEIKVETDRFLKSKCNYTKLYLNEELSLDSRNNGEVEETKDSRDSLLKAFEIESKKLLNIDNSISKRNQYKNALKANNYNEISSSIYYTARCDEEYESDESSCNFESDNVSFLQGANIPYLSRIINASKCI